MYTIIKIGRIVGYTSRRVELMESDWTQHISHDAKPQVTRLKCL